MTETVDIINFVITVSGLVVAIIGFLISVYLPYIDKKSRWFFVVFFALLFLYAGSDFLSQISLILMGQKYSLLSRIAIFGESFFSSAIMPLLTIYMLSSAGVLWRRSPYLYASLSIWAVYVCLLLST